MSSESDECEVELGDSDYDFDLSSSKYSYDSHLHSTDSVYSDSSHINGSDKGKLIIGSKEWNTFRRKEIRERRKARGLQPGEYLERLPPVPGYEHLQGGARTKQRALWLGLSGQGKAAKDLRRIDSPVFVKANEMREANPDLMHREALIKAAKWLEERYNLKPGRYSARILPDFVKDKNGEWQHNPVGVHHVPRSRKKKMIFDGKSLSDFSDAENNEEGSCDGEKSNKKTLGKGLTNAQSVKRSRERRKRLGIPMGQPLPKTPLIPPELSEYSSETITRLNLEMLGIGKEGKRAPDLKLVPTTVIWNAYWMHQSDPGSALRQCLRSAAIAFEKEHGLEPGDYSKHILSDFQDGTTRPTGVPLPRKPID